jgi:hypothetical protein
MQGTSSNLSSFAVGFHPQTCAKSAFIPMLEAANNAPDFVNYTVAGDPGNSNSTLK